MGKVAPAYVALGALQMSPPENSLLRGTLEVTLGVTEREGVGTRLEPLSICERQMKDFPHRLLSLSPSPQLPSLSHCCRSGNVPEQLGESYQRSNF